ncbi:hypothetical protein EUX98_g2428 [Antrodiella citrinella]|uniref:Uncharacterized protein n=1 Tax=Antrodiella citrinella TaxID=2447956 RepID=A0A4V6S1X1_9APHY|nr:hypothetical protein EUX98_g2428 [Antrodiella citrinella]
MPLDDDDIMMISRSNSVPNGDLTPNGESFQNADEDSSASTAKRPRRDKGKGKEREAAVRVKEEPGMTILQDSLAVNPPPKPPASLKFMAPLFAQLQSTIPHEFQLPGDIRTFFKDVAMSNRGGYVDSSELKPPRLNRHGQLEDRDPYRLKDRNGDPRPKKRVPRGVQPIEISRPGEFNNGNIEVIHPEVSVAPAVPVKMNVDEVLINGRRYRVPEKIITMDFWNKTRRRENIREDDNSSAMSSPLTSLSSLDEMEEVSVPHPQPGLFNVDELKAALFLINLHSKAPSIPRPNGVVPVASSSKPVASSSTLAPPIRIKEEPDLHVNGLLSRAEPPPKRAKRVSTRTPRAIPLAATATASKSLRSSARVQAAAAKKVFETEYDSSATPDSHTAIAPPPRPKSSQKISALIPQPNGVTAGSSSSHQLADVGGSASAPVGRAKRARQPRRKPSPVRTSKVVSLNGNAAAASTSALESASHDEGTGGWGFTDTAKKPAPSSSRNRSHPKPITPSVDKPAVVTPVTPVVAGSSKPANAPTSTPSLKIRLPRLSSLNSPILASSATTSSADKASTASRARTSRSRRPYDRPNSNSTSHDGPSSGIDGVMLPPV